jgi:hypothetical protein
MTRDGFTPASTLLIQRFVDEAINRKNLDAIDELVAENFLECVGTSSDTRWYHEALALRSYLALQQQPSTDPDAQGWDFQCLGWRRLLQCKRSMARTRVFG